MKAPIDLEKAAEAEMFGALAVRRNGKHHSPGKFKSGRSPAQERALGELLCSLLEFAKEAGAGHRPVKVGNVSLKLSEQGSEEILSVRKTIAA